MNADHANRDGLNTGCWLEMADVRVDGLEIDRFQARSGEAWCVYGDNRSGIDRFVELFRGEGADSCADRLNIPPDLGVVSFRDQQELFEQEVLNDESDFLDRIDPGTPAREFLKQSDESDTLTRQFRLDHVMNSGYRQLSSGESRKLLILKAVTDGARNLVIENPYDGLDADSCAEFDRVMELLIDQEFNLLIICSSRFDIPRWCTHLGWIDHGRMEERGIRDNVIGKIVDNRNVGDWQLILEGDESGSDEHESDELIRLVNGHARYGDKTIFSGFDFSLNRNQHTLITGPNGAGKSTLLSIVTGDHPDCYTNELYVFGNRRGSGESIWQLKKDMGIVSPALHREHYIPGNALQIVISGFFDSIGLYRQFSYQQQQTARSWLNVIGLGEREKIPFRRLGFGEQRLVLIARALIKMPQLLVLDEPTHGLDDANRDNLLNFLEVVVEKEISTIVYVSHRRDEYRRFFRQHIDFGQM